MAEFHVMNHHIGTGRIPVKLWLETIEESALEQIRHLADLPFAFKHIAIMPDCHPCQGMPVGAVVATMGAVIPNAVGSDAGCGMCAVRLDIKGIDIEKLKIIMGRIRETIPVGFEHRKMSNEALMPKIAYGEIVKREWDSATRQMGTLGSGNHFIEIQKGSDGHIWIMVHSGSRNLGNKVAEHYNKIAVELNGRWHSSVPAENKLAFLPIESQEAKKYMEEMIFCLEFAKANRALMMSDIKNIFHDITGASPVQEINIHHNYAAWENHFGKNVIVHRKGATSARKDEFGIIPGSQGTKSYIVKGKGVPESFMSCSHGSGRRIGRKEARRVLNLEEEQRRLNEKGILHSIRSQEDLDEAAGAYKNIDEVMENQKDLVDIVVELTPLGVVKG